MKALTVRQPYATLIARGVKTIETRSWRTNYRGRLAIHAGKSLTYIDGDAFGDWYIDTDNSDRARLHHCRIMSGPDSGHILPLGAVVATANLVACVPMVGRCSDLVPHVCRSGSGLLRHTALAAPESGETEWDITDQLPYGDYAPGRWAWILGDIEPCGPFWIKGKQGLWTWSP